MKKHKVPEKKVRLKGERKLYLPEYRRWLHDNYSGEIHHYFARSDISVNDFFVTMLSREEHAAIHSQSGLNPRQWREKQGVQNLIEKSIELMWDWVNEMDPAHSEILHDMLFWVYASPENALEITREAATKMKNG